MHGITTLSAREKESRARKETPLPPSDVKRRGIWSLPTFTTADKAELEASERRAGDIVPDGNRPL